MGKKVTTGAAAARPWLAHGTKITDQTKQAFLFALAELGNESEAAAVAGCSASGIRHHTNPELPCYDPEFAQAWAEAREAFVASLHKAAVKRATEGWQEPIIGGEFRDQVVAHKPMFSDRLLELLLKRYDGNYRERVSVDHNSHKTVTHKLDLSTLTPEARKMARAMLDAQMMRTEAVDVEVEEVKQITASTS